MPKKEKDPEKVKIGKRSKARGKRFERKAAHILTDLLGVPFRRGVQYQGGHDSDDVVSDIDGLHWEMKFVEKLNIETAMVQSETDAKPDEVPVVFHARSRKEPMITIRAKNLIQFAKIINKVIEEKENESVSDECNEQSEAGLDGVCKSPDSAE